ncbi:MAG: YidC/Oxa1 family membrane protein insertase [Actinobacteria bacterium]|nr:YidC/Oxa1 family membrane protein insertase [Actinomycetota bacterium]
MGQLLNLLKPIQSAIEYVVIFLYNNVIANYGIVIILLTIIVRLVLTPLTLTQTKSMARMQRLQPQLQELQKKYKDDKQRLQQETMAFYKQNNVNPLAGCLPLLLQLPVFFALFQALRLPSQIVTDVIGTPYLPAYMLGSIKNFIANIPNPNFNFLWMDLNARDPYYILVILMVATMFVSTKMTSTDPKQKMITYAMPLLFGVISWSMPSGILIYWTTTNIWSIGQQWLVNKYVKKEARKEESKTKAEQMQKKAEAAAIVQEQEPEKRKKKRKRR